MAEPRKRAKAPDAAEPPARFEDALRALEAAVEDLERGDLPIDDALARYEAGIAQLRRCQQILKRAEQRVEELLRDEDGHLRARPLEPGEG